MPLLEITCNQCGHTWIARTEKPAVCPNKHCHSPHYNKPHNPRHKRLKGGGEQ